MSSTLHIDCMPKNALKVLKQLAIVIRENEFILGGGTALALQMGHRISVDLDFFSQREFSTELMYQEIKRAGYDPKVLQEEKNTLTVTADGVKISMFHYPYQFLDLKTQLNEIPVAGVLDIASMKIIAISQRGAKRDFVDLFFILQEKPFWKIAENMVLKFGRERINPLVIGKALVYFADAEGDPEPRFCVKNPPWWRQIKKFFENNVQQMTIDLQKARG